YVHSPPCAGLVSYFERVLPGICCGPLARDHAPGCWQSTVRVFEAAYTASEVQLVCRCKEFLDVEPDDVATFRRQHDFVGERLSISFDQVDDGDGKRVAGWREGAQILLERLSRRIDQV